MLSLLLLSNKALRSALEKGFALSVAAVKRNNKIKYKYKVSDWDNRCETCLKDEMDEED